MWTGHPILSVGIGLLVTALTMSGQRKSKEQPYNAPNILGAVGLGLAFGYLWVLGALFILVCVQNADDNDDNKDTDKGGTKGRPYD